MFAITQNLDGTTTVAVTLTLTMPDMIGAQLAVRDIREVIESRDGTPSQGDYITTVHTPEDGDIAIARLRARLTEGA